MKDNDERARKGDAMQRISVVQEILRRWNPIGQSIPTDEYDGYAPHIVSMISQGCSLEDLCAHLESIRVSTIGVGPDSLRDREIASEILLNS